MDCPLSPCAWKRCGSCKEVKSTLEFNRGRKSRYTKNCSPCCKIVSGYVRVYSKSSKGKATQARHQKTEKRKISKARHKTTERFSQTEAAYAPRKKELRIAEYQRIHSNPGLHLEHGIGVTIGRMIHGIRNESQTVISYSDFTSRNDMLQHFESTFDVGMSFDNHGKHEVGGPPVWNVGHRIARFHFDTNNPEDVRRCWKKQNLFAQWAKENLSAKVKLPEEEKLIELRSSWPTAWNDQLPSQPERVQMERAVFARCGKYVRE